MTAFPSAGVLGSPSVTTGAFQTAIEAFLAATKQLPGAQAFESLTIASGNITPTRALFKVDTEAAASTDNLDHILTTNLPAGSIVIVRAANTTRDVICKHAVGGSGQLMNADGADFNLNDTEKMICYFLESTTWVELWRSYGNDDAKARTDIGLGTIATFNQGSSPGQSPAHVPRVDDIVGRQSIWVPATAMFVPITNPALAPSAGDVSGVQIMTSQFDDGATKSLGIHIGMPKMWNGGTITYEVYWTTLDGSANSVVWELKAASQGDNELNAYGTAVTVTDANNGVLKVNVSAESAALTVGSTPTGNREFVNFLVSRLGANGSDTLAAAAFLFGIKIFYTTNALNDS